MNPLIYNANPEKEKTKINIPDFKPNLIAEIPTSTLITEPYLPKIEVTEEQSESTTPVVKRVEQKLGKIEFAKNNIDVGNMAPLLNLFVKHGINVRVTSGVRKGAKTKSGNTSYHSTGDAIDITPIEGETFESLKSQIRSSEEIMNYLRENKIGLLDETTPDVMKRTGATGAHFHIGKDKVAQKFLGQKGFKFPLIYSYDDPNEYYDYENGTYDPINKHWTSRDPKTGLLLKHPNHPTYYKTIKGEREAENKIYYNVGQDRYYSFSEDETKGITNKAGLMQKVEDDRTWFDKVTQFQNAFENFLSEAKEIPQEDRTKPKQWLIGYGMSKIYDAKEKKWRPVREGDKLTKAQAEEQREKWYDDIFRSEVDRLKLYHFDEYPDELKFQLFDLLYNTSGIEKDSVGRRTAYLQELLNYESKRGFKSNKYDLRKILQHADWSLNHITKSGTHSSLGLRSIMRRNPNAIDYEDLEIALITHKWDELWNKYDKIWNLK